MKWICSLKVNNQGIAHLGLIILVMIGVILFILATTVFKFTSQTHEAAYPEPESEAAEKKEAPSKANVMLPPVAPEKRLVYAHYYPWWGPNFGHWDAGNSKRPDPADNIATAFYPVLGPYNNQENVVIDQHMKWLVEAKVNVVTVSWWGIGSPEDDLVSKILDYANKYKLKVNFTIEPYGVDSNKMRYSRTPQSTVKDIGYLTQKYASHSAFLKLSRPTKNSNTKQERGVFFVFRALENPGGGERFTREDWQKVLGEIRGTDNDAIVLLDTDASKMYVDADVQKEISATGADGMYSYDVKDYSDIKNNNYLIPRSDDYILVYAVSPGYDDSRVRTPSSKTDREAGKFYDRSWQWLVKQKPEGVAILSFNEWHEGTQIEPAISHTYKDFKYLDYEGHYNKTGASANKSYIEQTRFWVDEYKTD